MNKKIIWILVITLFIVITIPAVTCINNIDSYTTRSSTTEVGSKTTCYKIQKADIIPSTNCINILKNNIIYVDDNNINGPWYGTMEHPYQKIDDAVTAAKIEDTVFVYNGNYEVAEGIYIKHPLNLTGEDKYNTVINGNERGDPIKILSSNVNINNFTVKGSKRQDPTKTYAGIRIVGDYKNINISNNIINNNSHGIMIGDVSYLNIYNNEIYNNDYDGIILQSVHDCFIENNTIYNNGYNYFLDTGPDGDGFDIRHSNNNKILNNIISNNKVDGIWLDCAENIFNNLFLNNQILENKQYGIHFGNSDSDPKDGIIKNNTFSNNLIKNNYNGGISIRYAKENYFFENTIEDNGDFGIKILYNDEKDLICENNKIYHNNFVKNGEYKLFYKPDYKKFCNAVDSNNWNFLSAVSYNQWDNGIIDDKINATCNSERGGNYWDDYEERYKKNFADNEYGYHGTWKLDYNMKIQYHLLLYEGYINETINFDFLVSKASDQYPWCRVNGWKPNPPDKPLLKVSQDFINHLKYFINCSTYDSNYDKIIYEFNITNNETDETITSGWQIINAEPINSSATAVQIWKFKEYGTYTIYIRAYDVRDSKDNDGKGYDGQSEITQITIFVG